MNRFLLPALLVFGTLGACQRTPSHEELLQRHAWVLAFGKTTETTAAGKVTVYEYKSGPSSCLSDDFITLLPNHQLARNTGTISCSPSEAPVERSEWYLSQNQQTLITPSLFGQGYRYFQVYTIDALSESSLTVTYHYADANKTLVETQTLQAQ